MHACNWICHGLKDSPNGCEDRILEWGIGGRHLHGPTARIRARWQGATLDAKGTKCLFLGYCEGTKAYRFMCLQSKKIIKCRDVEFMEDSTSVRSDLEMRPSGRNQTPNVVIVDTFSKSPYVDDDSNEDPSNEEATPTPGSNINTFKTI
jgi:hypothetical protein